VQSDLDRFLALVRRELGAEDARVLDADHGIPDGSLELYCRMSDGRGLAVRFALPPPDRDLKQRRLEILVSSFDSVVEGDKPQRRSSRPPVVRVLHEELEALRGRAAAVNAIVIDANSPVEWGAARPQEVIPLEPRAPAPPQEAEGSESRGSEPTVAVASRRALHIVRGLPELAALRKGKHLRHLERVGETPIVAHSFAGIYVLVVVFDAPFDELRAERAIIESLPRIERLVLALPPLDPAPPTGIAALRRARRR
jgi:hypothetical protein